MKLSMLPVLVCLILGSCSTLKEIDPPSQTIPEEVIKVVKDKYPRSSELLFETLVQNQIWTTRFVNEARPYQAVVDQRSFLSTSRLLAGNMPDSLKALFDDLAIGDAAYSGLREVSPDSASLPYLMQFATNAVSNGRYYTLRGFYKPSQDFRYYLYMTPQADWEYGSDNLSLMPEAIRNFMTQRTRLQEHFQVYVGSDKKKTYVGENVIFNDAGEVLFSFMGQTTRYTSLGELPVALRGYVSERRALDGFVMSSGYGFTDGDAKGYRLTMRKERAPISEVFNLYFSNDAKLVYETYGAYVRPK